MEIGEEGIIEGTIGTDFNHSEVESKNLIIGLGYLRDINGIYKGVKEKKVGCYTENDIMTRPKSSGKSEKYINIKLWIDNKLMKTYEVLPSRKLYVEL